MSFEEYNAVTKQIIKAAIEVHKELGPGLLESVYEHCFVEELNGLGLKCSQQVKLPLIYKGKITPKTFIIDMLVEDKIIVELKTVEEILPIHEMQLISYLKLSNLKLGLLINFHEEVLRDGIRRRINGTL